MIELMFIFIACFIGNILYFYSITDAFIYRVIFEEIKKGPIDLDSLFWFIVSIILPPILTIAFIYEASNE